MLTITIPSREYYDETKQEFINIGESVISLEHSLVSIAKWESKWKVPFLSKNKSSIEHRTEEQFIDYIKCMTITQNVNDNIYKNLSLENLNDIKKYIEDPMTATWFKENKNNYRPSNGEVTAEVIYYWMIEYNIPMECQKWHFNRLMTLIRVCNEKQNTKPMKKGDILKNYAALNKARRKH